MGAAALACLTLGACSGGHGSEGVATTTTGGSHPVTRPVDTTGTNLVCDESSAKNVSDSQVSLEFGCTLTVASGASQANAGLASISVRTGSLVVNGTCKPLSSAVVRGTQNFLCTVLVPKSAPQPTVVGGTTTSGVALTPQASPKPTATPAGRLQGVTPENLPLATNVLAMAHRASFVGNLMYFTQGTSFGTLELAPRGDLIAFSSVMLPQAQTGAFTYYFGQQTYGSISFVTSDGSKFYLANSGEGWVGIWNGGLSTAVTSPADIVLGNQTFGSPSQSSGPEALRAPSSIFISKEGHVIVCDAQLNQVKIWTSPLTQSGQAPDVILGYPPGTGHDGPARDQMSGPTSVVVADDKLYVADDGNHRLLYWKYPIVSSGAPADGVIGQADFTSNVDCGAAQSCGATGFHSADPLGYDGTRFFLTDSFSSRTLIWFGAPTRVGQPADDLMGPADFTSPAPASYQQPAGYATLQNVIYVASQAVNAVYMMVPR